LSARQEKSRKEKARQIRVELKKSDMDELLEGSMLWLTRPRNAKKHSWDPAWLFHQVLHGEVESVDIVVPPLGPSVVQRMKCKCFLAQVACLFWHMSLFTCMGHSYKSNFFCGTQSYLYAYDLL
jgi:hypothetical protein